MKIIIKEREDGVRCLYDTRSNQFFEGGCVKSDGVELLDIANNVVNKSYKTIVDIADSFHCGDYGYTEPMIAEKYLQMNPDIRTASKSLSRLVVGSRYRGKKRGRKPKEDKVEKVKILDANGQPRKRGRPRKVVV